MGNGFYNRFKESNYLPINLPNIITIARILMVPVIVWLIVSNAFVLAFFVFIAAGVSDAIDGFIAKHFDLATELGAYLDPIADKLLLVAIYLSLGFLEHLPAWLVILVVSRDFLIIGGMLLAWLIDRPIEVHPLWISKINTTLQIVLAGAVLGILAFEPAIQYAVIWGSIIVGVSTIASGSAYIRQWLQHMNNGNSVADNAKSD